MQLQIITWSLSGGLMALCATLAPAHNCSAGIFQPGEFITWSQDDWGASPAPGNAAQLLAAQFDNVYPAGVEVGTPGLSGYSMLFTSAASVFDYLPASGANGPLNTDLADPSSSASGELGGHVLALQINIDFNDSGLLTGSSGTAFGELILTNLIQLPQYNGLTLRQYLAEANGILGAVIGVNSYDDISLLTRDLTLAFEGGTPSAFAQQHLMIPAPPAVAMLGLAALLGVRGLSRPRRSQLGRGQFD